MRWAGGDQNHRGPGRHFSDKATNRPGGTDQFPVAARNRRDMRVSVLLDHRKPVDGAGRKLFWALAVGRSAVCQRRAGRTAPIALGIKFRGHAVVLCAGLNVAEFSVCTSRLIVHLSPCRHTATANAIDSLRH